MDNRHQDEFLDVIWLMSVKNRLCTPSKAVKRACSAEDTRDLRKVSQLLNNVINRQLSKMRKSQTLSNN